jgi:hypothetical protein
MSKEIGFGVWLMAGLLALGIAAPTIADDNADANRMVAQTVVLQKQAEGEREACFRVPTSKCVVLQALRSTEGITDARVLAHTLTSIAEAQAEAGDIAGMRKTTDGITDIGERGFALMKISIALAEAGDVPGGLKIAEDITDADHQVQALVSISLALAHLAR